MTVFKGPLLIVSSDSLSLDQAGKTKVSTTNLPSGPLSTATFPPGPESKVRFSASVCGWIGMAAICARNAASGSAGGALCCCARKGTAARSNDAGESCARKALPASVAESRSIARREVGFRKELQCMKFSSFRLVLVCCCVCGGDYTSFRAQQAAIDLGRLGRAHPAHYSVRRALD